MDITQLDQTLRAKKIASCYLISGPERHLAFSAERQILKTVFGSEPETVDRFQLGTAKLAAVLDCLKTASLLSPRRVVVATDADRLKKPDWELLQEYLINPNPQSVLILLAEELKAADLKKISGKAAVVECKKLYPNQLPQWINMEAKSSGLQISQEAARFLADCVGADLGAIHQSLEKLLLFVGAKKLIDLADVEKVIANTAQKNIFEMTNAIGNKKSAEAIRYLDNIFSQGEEPLRTFAMIVRHFRLLAKAQEILARGNGPETQLAKELGVHPFFAKDYAVQARHFRPKGWAKRFKALADCDRALKSSRVSSQLLLERLISKLCRDNV